MTPRAIVACLVWAWSTVALALDPALDASQYGHTAWRIRDGFTKGRTIAFAQTPHGYLWLGTEFGLVRFDGVRAVPWVPPPGAALPADHVRALLAGRDGTLWIGTLRGLAAWDGRKLLNYPQLDGGMIHALHEDHEGTLWVGASAPNGGLLCSIRRGTVECQGGDGSLGIGIGNLYEQSNGALWAAALNRIWRLKPAPPKTYTIREQIGSLQAVTETASGAMIVGTSSGIREMVDGRLEPYVLPEFRGRFGFHSVLHDSDGALWVSTDHGLLHVHGGRTDAFARADGLSGDDVDRLFEDREGSIWVATSEGIDRFRALAAATLAKPQGLDRVASVLAARDGSIWVGTVSGLKRWHGGRVAEVNTRGMPKGPVGSLFQDRGGRIWVASRSRLGYFRDEIYTSIQGVPPGYIDSFAEDKDGYIWVGHRESGLLRISPTGVINVARKNPNQFGTRLAADPLRGGVWIGSFTGGLVHFVDGRIAASYSARDGLGKGAVNQVSVSADGAVWAATEGGLSRLKGGRIATLDTGGGLPCDQVHWMIEDAEHDWWLYTACGLVRLAQSELDAWVAAVDAGKAPRRIVGTVLDSSDGVRSVSTVTSYSPQAARSGDGKLWFLSSGGLTMVDPRHLHLNKQPPPVHIEGIVADRKTYEASSGVRLPPLVRDLEIQYTATSLVAPEKMQFKYKLEGRDKDWNDAGNRRQAFYTDLDPGKYRFRVIASNNSGVWNEQGATLEFSVAPAFWQTIWFRALCVVAFAVFLWALDRLRLRRVARQFNATLEARVSERTRIARELHDTLLQGFHGVLLKFQTVAELLPAGEPKRILARTIDQAAAAITEGRDAVQGLRASATETNDLAESIRSFGDELAEETGGKVALRMEVLGVSRALHPIVRDEIFRIASEALRNAFRHAGAKRIEVELRYDARRLRLGVRDDGCGIAPEVLSAGGREGHFGLHGMRERAKLIGGKLAVWSAAESGTEIELTIPAASAYAARLESAA